MKTDFGRTAKALLGEGRAAWARNYQAMSGLGYPKIFDSGAQWSLRAAAHLLPFAWARELAAETANKHHAFTQFQNAKRAGAQGNALRNFFANDPHHDIWRAEGLGAHFAERPWSSRASAPARFSDLCAKDEVPSSFLLPLHTGGGLFLAEKAVRNHLRTRNPLSAAELPADFLASVDERSETGLREATFEALGLVLQTLYPDLLLPVTDYLREQNPTGYRLVWHGAGRGHYFDPFHLLLPSALRQQSYLATTDDAALNRLAGYAWASTMVNLRSPAATATVLASLPLANPKSLAAVADGVSAASLVWLAMTDDRSPVGRLEEALAVPGVFRNPSASKVIRHAIIERAQTHPTSLEALGALFSFDPD